MSTDTLSAVTSKGFFTAGLAEADPEIAGWIAKELGRQRDKIELIASENITSRAVLEATGSILTNKYAEGYPGKRYYQGCHPSDVVEQLANDRAKQLLAEESRRCSSNFQCGAHPGGTSARVVVGLSLGRRDAPTGQQFGL